MNKIDEALQLAAEHCPICDEPYDGAYCYPCKETKVLLSAAFEKAEKAYCDALETVKKAAYSLTGCDWSPSFEEPSFEEKLATLDEEANRVKYNGGREFETKLWQLDHGAVR